MISFGKMKIPRFVDIGSEKIEVIFDKEVKPMETRLSFSEKKLIVGIMNVKESRWPFILALLIHELLEAICLARGFRFDNGMGDLLIITTHNEFNIACEDLATILSKFVIKGGSDG